MASRLGRILLQSSRPNLRVASRNAGRRMMSSAAPAQSSDTAWIIGSGLVFGPVIVYLLSPKGKTKAHKKADAHVHTHDANAPPPNTGSPVDASVKTETPVTDDEGTEVPAAEVNASLQTAYNTDSPKDAQAAEEQPSEGGPGLTDAEGETASPAEINASTEQAFKSDSPADAQTAEEAPTTPGTDEGKEGDAEPEEKPAGEHPGTLQGEENQGAADLGEARSRSKAGQAPKAAAKDQ